MRRNISLALTMLFAAIAFGMGEGGAFLIDLMPISIALLGCFIVAAAVPGSLLKKGIVWVGSFAIITAAYFTGAYSFNRAFNECVHKGEAVRAQLEEYHAGHKQYPESLKLLNGPLPGKRVTRPTILVYKRTQDGYELAFQDWLVEFKATESEPFLEHK